MRLFRKNKKMICDQLTNFNRELKKLVSIAIENHLKIDPKLSSKLDEVNPLLWKIEDKIRFKETLN